MDLQGLLKCRDPRHSLTSFKHFVECSELVVLLQSRLRLQSLRFQAANQLSQW